MRVAINEAMVNQSPGMGLVSQGNGMSIAARQGNVGTIYEQTASSRTGGMRQIVRVVQ